MADALIKGDRQKKRLHLAAGIITFFLFPTAAFNLAVLGVDPSWSLSINMAVQQGLVFGKDWIFTFGPLGYLFTRNPFGINTWPIILYDLFVAANVYFVVYKHLQKLKTQREWWVCLLILLLVRGAWESFLLFYLLLFHLFYALKTRRLVHLWLAGVLALLLFYIKLNLGLVAVLCFYGFLVFALLSRRLSLAVVLGAALLYGLLTWLLATGLNVWLPGYVAGALHLIDAYNDAMAVNDIYFQHLILGIVVLLAMLFSWPLFRYFEEIKKPANLLLYLLVSLALFLLLKTSFVRAHWTMFGEFHIHASAIFVYACLFISLLYYFTAAGTALHRYFQNYLVVALLASVVGLNLLVLGYGTNAYINSKLSLYQRSFLKQRYPALKAGNIQHYYPQLIKDAPTFIANSLLHTLPYLYLKDIVSDSRQKAVQRIAKKRRQLPERFLQQIRNATVDMLPFEISYIYFNELQYNPRPVVQSYSAYDAWLDSVNAAKYASASAPAYLLFQNQSIDERYPFWDETKTKLAILQHYAIADSALLPEEDEPTLLFKQMDVALPVYSSKKVSAFTAALADTIPIPASDELLVMYADIEYNWWGKIRRLFQQPPGLEVTLVDENNKAKSFKAIVPILKGGVICNYWVPDTYAAFHFFRRDRSKVKHIRKIVFKELNSGFVQTCNIRIEKYSASTALVSTGK